MLHGSLCDFVQGFTTNAPFVSMVRMSENHMDASTNVYELSYLIVPDVAEEDVVSEMTALKDQASRFGASFISEEAPKYIDLAYQMERDIANKKHKFNNGYFGWVKFELPPEKVAELNEELARSDKLIRFMIISTVKENTMAPKKAPRAEGRTRTGKKEEGEETEEEMSTEEVDKKIEEMATAE
ncbi:MAG: 30S ribosomal protein S6 [Candidatus Pacebacteria bacterium]|jgi:ribosomal protein S6|nr:30S ribosomal protein S6 [Candidatus Paceibacterota bacterium]